MKYTFRNMQILFGPFFEHFEDNFNEVRTRSSLCYFKFPIIITGKPGTTPDTVNNFGYLSEVYALSRPEYDGRWTVPVLFDKLQKKIVCNESSEIIRMLTKEFDEFCPTLEQKELDLYPKELRKDIDEMNDWVYPYV